MWIPCDYKQLGTIDKSITDPVRELINSINWSSNDYNRYELPLKSGKLIVFPYLIYHANQVSYSDPQRRLLEAFDPVVDEVMKLFQGYIKVRGEIATLLPNTSLESHFDNQWFHQHCRRIHVPITTNNQCQQIFEDRIYHLEENKIYEINNRNLHSASNFGTTDRTHLILDLLDETIYNSIDRNKKKLIEKSVPETYQKNERKVYKPIHGLGKKNSQS